MSDKLREALQQIHDLCWGETNSGTPGDLSHADADHAKAHAILDSLLASEAEAEIREAIDAAIQWVRDSVTEIGCASPKESDYVDLEKYICAELKG